MTKSFLLTIVIAILIAVLLIGFLPNDSAFFVSIKILLSVVLGVGAYVYLFRIEPETAAGILPDEDEETDTETTQQDNTPLPKSSEKSDSRGVENYFDDFLETLLPQIQRTTVSKTVALLMVNFYKKQFYLRSFASESATKPDNDIFFGLSEGLPALIFKEKKSLLENSLPESDGLLPYHDPETKVRSFIGVPLMYNDFLIGVLCADSDIQGAFSNDDLKILESFSTLMSIQLACSNKLYEYETENRTTKMLYDFTRQIQETQSLKDLWQQLSIALKSVFKADSVIIAERAGKSTAKITFGSENNGVYPAGEVFPNNEGLLGWVLRKNECILIEDFSSKENYIPRMSLNETPVTQFKSMLAVPVVLDGDAQMVVSIESKKAFQFDEQHKNILETMAYQVANYLDKTWTIRQLEQHNLIDPESGLGNHRGLLKELEKEIDRAKSFDKIFCLQLLKISTAKADLAPQIYDRLVREVLAFTIPLFGKNTYLFKMNDSEFALLWPEQVLREVFTEFQEIYRKIAQKRPWVDGHVEKVYVNCGVVEYPQMGQSVNELIENARKALRKAEQRGPNTMEIFEDPQNGRGKETT